VDPEEFLAFHYSAVPDLLEAQGGPQPAPADLSGDDLVGAYLPGTEFWLGVDRSLLSAPARAWLDRGSETGFSIAQPNLSPEISVGRDGHVLHLGARFAEAYRDRQEAGRRTEGEGEG